MSLYQVSVRTGTIKTVLIIKQLDLNVAFVEVCYVLCIFNKYLLPNKINNADIVGSSKDAASGHCGSLVGWNAFIQTNAVQCILYLLISNTFYKNIHLKELPG